MTGKGSLKLTQVALRVYAYKLMPLPVPYFVRNTKLKFLCCGICTTLSVATKAVFYLA